MPAALMSPAVTPLPAYASEIARWRAVVQRDADADGQFVYAVRTTGVYCRPSCPSRQARREHVSFHADAMAARAAGFRACRRCHPDAPSAAGPQAEAVTRACRLIEAADTPPRLDALAAAAGLSPAHFHRVFRRLTGVTPHAYAAAYRARRMDDALRGGASVTAALYDAGFTSASAFYAGAGQTRGMPPRQARAGGAGALLRHAVAPCSLGQVLVAATERGLCAVTLGDDAVALERDLQARFPRATLIPGDAAFAATVAQVVALIEAPAAACALPLDVQGTAFQQRVWTALQAIPPGATSTYTAVAQRIGQPAAVRAVAGACAANALAVLIPCHRVLRQDGALSGYRWGVERKRALLDRERTAAAAPPEGEDPSRPAERPAEPPAT